MEVNGIIRGGHFDGEVFISDLDRIILPLVTEKQKVTRHYVGFSPKEPEQEMIQYKKCWHMKDGKTWYEWRM